MMWPDLVYPDDRGATEAAWAEARERGERFEVRHRLLTDDGPCWVISRARPFADEEGRVTAWFGTVTEVNALVRVRCQQTIVVPGKDGLFVLQLNGEAPAGQEQVVIDAANLIREQTTVTLPS